MGLILRHLAAVVGGRERLGVDRRIARHPGRHRRDRRKGRRHGLPELDVAADDRPVDRRGRVDIHVVRGEDRCEDFSDKTPLEPGGVVQFNGKQPADFARIRPDVCTRLLRFISAPRGAYDCVVRRSCNPSLADTAQALTVLAHESIHLRGVHNEAVTQCYARPCRRWRVRLERQRRTAALSHCWSTRWTIHICRPRIGRRSAIREDRWI
jgi:hypothetical protein